MSIEFALQYACPLRATYSEKHLREWGRLSSLHDRLTTGDEAVPTSEKISWIERARDEVEVLQEATKICPQCPASLPLENAGDGESVGCLGRINYPIEAQFEKFLADRIQLSLDTLDREDQHSTSYTREFPLAAAGDYYDFLDLLLRSELTVSEVTRLTARSRNYGQYLRC